MHSAVDTIPPFAPLVAHPSTPCDWVWRFEASAHFTRPGVLKFHYSLHAETGRLRVSPLVSGTRTDGLWQHTCFEAFVAPHDPASPSRAAAASPATRAYLELNFAPSGNWALYRFSAYRAGMSPADNAHPPEIRVRRLDTRLELEATVNVSDLPELRGAGRLRLALAAVLEEESDRLSYWALRHAPGKPDFHHCDGFALELPS